jgi:hypothetical protein
MSVRLGSDSQEEAPGYIEVAEINSHGLGVGIPPQEHPCKNGWYRWHRLACPPLIRCDDLPRGQGLRRQTENLVEISMVVLGASVTS